MYIYIHMYIYIYINMNIYDRKIFVYIHIIYKYVIRPADLVLYSFSESVIGMSYVTRVI